LPCFTSRPPGGTFVSSSFQFPFKVFKLWTVFPPFLLTAASGTSPPPLLSPPSPMIFLDGSRVFREITNSPLLKAMDSYPTSWHDPTPRHVVGPFPLSHSSDRRFLPSTSPTLLTGHTPSTFSNHLLFTVLFSKMLPPDSSLNTFPRSCRFKKDFPHLSNGRTRPVFWFSSSRASHLPS